MEAEFYDDVAIGWNELFEDRQSLSNRPRNQAATARKRHPLQVQAICYRYVRRDSMWRLCEARPGERIAQRAARRSLVLVDTLSCSPRVSQ